MANPLFIPTTIDTAVLTSTLADYSKTLTDNVYNASVVFRVLNEAGSKETKNGGGSVVYPIITDEQDAGGFYLGADVLNNTQPNTTTQAEFRWQNAYEPIVITRDEERSNSGDMHKIIDLVGMKTNLSQKAFAERMDKALSRIVGGANNLVDLSTLVNTGVLGTVNGATTTAWQATSTTSGTFATQGLSDMTTLYYAISSSASQDNPDRILTTKTIYEAYEQTRLPLERISNTLTANAGFQNLTFKGVPVIYGNNIDSGVIYMLNMNYVHLVVDSATDVVTTPFLSPTNQTVKVAYILWRGNLTTDNRRRLGKLTSVS
jgi:hypothetical protein